MANGNKDNSPSSQRLHSASVFDSMSKPDSKAPAELFEASPYDGAPNSKKSGKGDSSKKKFFQARAFGDEESAFDGDDDDDIPKKTRSFPAESTRPALENQRFLSAQLPPPIEAPMATAVAVLAESDEKSSYSGSSRTTALASNGGGGMSAPFVASAHAFPATSAPAFPQTLPTDDKALKPVELSADQLENLRRDFGFTKGLSNALAASLYKFPLRIWVVDNSGSMSTVDGSRLVGDQSTTKVKQVECCRWKELQQSVEYHIRLAAALQAPTIFRMLNNPNIPGGGQIFGVADKGQKPAQLEDDVSRALKYIRAVEPSGVTPLVDHVKEIYETVSVMAPELRARGARVTVILATDGLPTDAAGRGGEHKKREFLDSLRKLQGLPLWMVVRLCTDDPEVVTFYNSLDSELEMDVEVLDDFFREAAEVRRKNKWLNHALPLYRCREFGLQHRLFDFLDERKLSKAEVQDLCRFLLGDSLMDGVGDAEVNMRKFVKSIEGHLKQEKHMWNPTRKKATAWIDVPALKKTYSAGAKCTIM